jgi:hypothetical protein
MPRRLSVVLIALIISAPMAAEYVYVDTDDVPVERLAKNLQGQLTKAPQRADLWRNLARLHAMAFARASDTVPVIRRRTGVEQEFGTIWFGHEPPNVPFARALTRAADPERRAAAQKHLASAIEAYRGALQLAPGDLVTLLGYAWCLQQAEETEKAIAHYRSLGDKAWATERTLNSAGLGWHSIAAEAATYLIPLLNEHQDREEIARLRARISQMRGVLRPITPIAVPLRGGLRAQDLHDVDARVRFDADGSGHRRLWTWITPAAAWLVHDPRDRGRIDTALRLFGGVSFYLFWRTGYDALAALDDNGDEQLRGRELAGLALWRDANRDGTSDPGEVRPLSSWGIVALSTDYRFDPAHPDEIAWSPFGVTFVDGTRRPSFDLVLHPR